MRARRASAALRVSLAVALAGCGGVHREMRREQGPLLRTYERDAGKEPAGLRAELAARWPSLEVRIASTHRCRTEVVREYAEEVVVEKSAPSAGPSIGMGVTITTIGAGLLAFRGAFSDAPNTSAIDGAGRYGPSDRQIATGWALPLLVAGLSSLAVGALELREVGEEVTRGAVEQVVDARESRCAEAPAGGTLELVGPAGTFETLAAPEGKATVSEAALRKGTVVGLALDGRPVGLDLEEAALLAATQGCLRIYPLPEPAVLAGASVPELTIRLERARLCEEVPGAPRDAVVALEGALAMRFPGLAGDRPEVGGARYRGLEDALAALRPGLKLMAGSADLAKLAAPEGLKGQHAHVKGHLAEVVEPNLALVVVEKQPLWLLGPDEWPGPSPQVGDSLEAVAEVLGKQRVGEVEAPLLRAVFVRKATE